MMVVVVIRVVEFQLSALVNQPFVLVGPVLLKHHQIPVDVLHRHVRQPFVVVLHALITTDQMVLHVQANPE